jgi:hypothetical protein
MSEMQYGQRGTSLLFAGDTSRTHSRVLQFSRPDNHFVQILECLVHWYSSFEVLQQLRRIISPSDAIARSRMVLVSRTSRRSTPSATPASRIASTISPPKHPPLAFALIRTMSSVHMSISDADFGVILRSASHPINYKMLC